MQPDQAALAATALQQPDGYLRAPGALMDPVPLGTDPKVVVVVQRKPKVFICPPEAWKKESS